MGNRSVGIRNRYIPSIEKLKNEFGLKKFQILDASIKKTIKFHESGRNNNG